MPAGRQLAGRRVVTTRDEPGRLDDLLAAAGATVVHVPLIEIVDPPDGGADLRAALDDLADAAWLVVTSRHGATRVAAAAAVHPHVRLAAVGTRTAADLTAGVGRAVDLVPARQTAADLVAAMPPATDGALVIVAQADRADDTLVDGLREAGYTVRAAVAYCTVLRTPTAVERREALAADAVAFASGSAVRAWVEAIGRVTPPVAAAIGPTTAAVARELGLQITHVAADHTVDGLAATVVDALDAPP